MCIVARDSSEEVAPDRDKVLRAGEYGSPDQVIIKGGRWGRETPLSYLDIAEMKGHQTPGPVYRAPRPCLLLPIVRVLSKVF